MAVVTTTTIVKVGVKVGTTVIKKGLEAVVNPEKTGSKVLSLGIVLCAPLLLVVVLICGVSSGVNGYVTNSMEDFFESDLYEQIETANEIFEFQTEVSLLPGAVIDHGLAYTFAMLFGGTEETAETTEAIETSTETAQATEATSEVIEITEETLRETVSHEEMQSVLAENYVSFDIEAPNLAYTLAYITHCEEYQSKWGEIFVLGEETEDEPTISGMQIRDYYDEITSVNRNTEIDEDGVIHITYYLEVMSPEAVAALYWPDDLQTQQMYVDSYEQFCIIYDISDEPDYMLANAWLSVPRYYQRDYAAVKYGRGTIASSGCAPTAIAMCVSYLTNQPVTPATVVNWTGDRYYNYGPGGGSYWTIFSACASRWGCTSTQISSSDIESVKDALKSGNPVIASMAPGHFTDSGHFIVICGMTEDGNLLVNDPSFSNYIDHGPQVPAEWVFTEAKGYFIFSGGSR